MPAVVALVLWLMLAALRAALNACYAQKRWATYSNITCAEFASKVKIVD